MASNMGDEEVLNVVRQQLNKDKIKLWLEPYTLENGAAGEHPEVSLSTLG